MFGYSGKGGRNQGWSLWGDNRTELEGVQAALSFEFVPYGPGRWGHTKSSLTIRFSGALQKNSGAYSHSDEGIYGTGRTGRFSACWVWLALTAVQAAECRVPAAGAGRVLSGRTDFAVPSTVLAPGTGVMMEVLKSMMEEEGIQLPVEGLKPGDLQAVMSLVAGTIRHGRG